MVQTVETVQLWQVKGYQNCIVTKNQRFYLPLCEEISLVTSSGNAYVIFLINV